MDEKNKIKKVVTIKLKCLLCSAETEIKVPVRSHGNLFYIDVPRKHCGRCFSELTQIIDNRGGDEKNTINSG